MKSSARAIGLAGALGFAGLEALSGSPPETPSPLRARVRPYVSSQIGLFANAYLVETRDGVVAVDATLTVSDAEAVRKQLDSLGRPLQAVLVTHGHPDHYNGLTQLVAGRSVPIISTPGVDRVIREWDARKEAQWKATFKEEWPTHRTFPNRRISDGKSVQFGGVSFTVHDLGPGESHHDSYWVASDGKTLVAFVGDLAFNGEHAYVSDGHTGAWLKNIEEARRALAGVEVIFPGHGPAGGVELLDRQKQYLERYREAVRSLADDRTALTDEEKKQLTDVMTAYLPGGKLTFLISIGADAVAAELAAKK